MSVKKKKSINLLTVAPQKQGGRAVVIGLAVLALALIIANQTGNKNIVRFRSALTDIVTGVVTIAAKPLDAVASAGEWVGETARLRAENIALKNANAGLMQWQSIAKNLEVENNNLRTMMNVVSTPKNNYITARIVTDMSGPYVRSALIGGGAEQGVKKDRAVINERGLVGRIIDVAENSSRVLLVTDINSRIPVMSESGRERMIMVGNNDKLPTLSYISSDSRIVVGERIITSGDGGVFPRGIAVGIVSEIEHGVIRVRPFVDAAAIEYVSIVDYSL